MGRTIPVRPFTNNFMQERRYYEDHEIQITASEIRCKQLTIRTDSVTSVSIASARPMKWLPFVILLPLLPIGFLALQFSALLGRGRASLFAPLLVGFLPMVLICVSASFMRMSRIYLQTSGGPVVLAFKIQFTDPATTLVRFQTIKDSVEQAMEAARAP